MNIGNLYKLNGKQFVAKVNYRLHNTSPTTPWGELTLDDCTSVDDGGGYVIELEDRNEFQCHLRRRVSCAVIGVPPRFAYHFSGSMLISPLP